MQDKLKTAVVGSGHLGRHHVRIYAESENSELIAVCDIDEKNGRRLADKYSVEYVKDYSSLYDKIDAVSIATPTENHFAIARDFLQKGVHTLIEKPITNLPEDAQTLIDIAAQNSCVLQVGHIERYNAAVKKAREYITSPRFIEVNRISKFPERSLDIGVVLDLMIHDIDIVLSFVDSKIKKIDSVGAPVLTDKEDIANSRIEFENGCVANLTASRISYKSERKFRVFQGDSYISLDYGSQDFVFYKKKKADISSPKDVERIAPKIIKTEPLKEEILDFIRNVQVKETPAVGGYQGLTALKLALEITKQIGQSL